ncbi:MAG: integrase core domain-containing protein [Terriglobales bacterium]
MHPAREHRSRLEDAQRLIQAYVEHYNNIRLNSAIGYITPKDMLAGPPAGDPR